MFDTLLVRREANVALSEKMPQVAVQRAELRDDRRLEALVAPHAECAEHGARRMATGGSHDFAAHDFGQRQVDDDRRYQ